MDSINPILPEEIVLTILTFSTFDDIFSYTLTTKKLYKDNNIWYELGRLKYGINKTEFLTNRYYPIEFPKTAAERYAQIASLGTDKCKGEVNHYSIIYLTPDRLLANAVVTNDKKYIQEALQYGARSYDQYVVEQASINNNREYIDYITYNNTFRLLSLFNDFGVIISSNNYDLLNWYIYKYIIKEEKDNDIVFTDLFKESCEQYDIDDIISLFLVGAYSTFNLSIVKRIESICEALYEADIGPLYPYLFREGLGKVLYTAKQYDLIERINKNIERVGNTEKIRKEMVVYFPYTKDRDLIKSNIDNVDSQTIASNMIRNTIDVGDVDLLKYVIDLIPKKLIPQFQTLRLGFRDSLYDRAISSRNINMVKYVLELFPPKGKIGNIISGLFIYGQTYSDFIRSLDILDIIKPYITKDVEDVVEYGGDMYQITWFIYFIGITVDDVEELELSELGDFTKYRLSRNDSSTFQSSYIRYSYI